MRPNFLLVLTAAALCFVALCALAKTKGGREYKSAYGYRGIVLPVGKPSSHEDYESRIEFYSPQNQMLCALDYSSEDGEHGFGVVKAAWTPDNNFFVFSLTSSGGHQAWHAPTLFFDVRDQRVRSLDTYAYREGTAGVCNSNFRFRAPSIVLTDVCTERLLPRQYDLQKLSKPDKAGSALHSLSCAGGKIITVDPSELVLSK